MIGRLRKAVARHPGRVTLVGVVTTLVLLNGAVLLAAGGTGGQTSDGGFDQSRSLKQPDRTAGARIRLGALPAQLPRAVRADEKKVVTVNVQLVSRMWDLASPSSKWTWVGGTGEMITHRLVLTAGHIFATPPVRVRRGANLCRATTIDAETSRADGYYQDGEPAFGTTTGVSHLQVSFGGLHSDTTPDAALALAKGEGLRRLGTIPVSAQPPTPGQRLYFINYESSPGLGIRDPNTDTLSLQQYDEGMYKPVIFGGIAAEDQGDTILVFDGLRSYGAMNVPSLHEGGSGGPVVNARGQLVGISNQHFLLVGANWTQEFPRPVQDVPAGYHPMMSVVQLINRAAIRRMASTFEVSSNC